MTPLFKAYPALQKALPLLHLGNFPTPVVHLDKLSQETGKNIYLKRDDISGEKYGGNKVRKLEFVLGEAKARGAQRVITVGGAGSNHALATAVYATQEGFNTTLMLFDQPNARSVRENLIADLSTGAELFLNPTYESHCRSLKEKIEEYTRKDGKPPFVIPAGGSSVIGTIGFVCAGFELAEQTTEGNLPRFATVYLALGTMGTAAGLLLGLKAAGMNCRVHAVRVVPTVVANRRLFAELFRKTNDFLKKNDPSFPRIELTSEDMIFDDSQFGAGYGIPTAQSQTACRLISDLEGISLDGTYTGKAFASLLETEENAPVLFWNTKNSRPLNLLGVQDYHRLPSPFHHYFEEDIS
ncbi:MAG: 1-aminocyclopropane-1-carboxylate deaminase/D-cysteine desulfhydrase [Chitinispirillaceae bacterium]